jgi:hypothetical protein
MIALVCGLAACGQPASTRVDAAVEAEAVPQRGNTMTVGEETYAGLRETALSTSADQLQLTLDDRQLSAFGVLMEMGFEGATVTLVSFTTGDASLYLSTGGGIIGGIGHETVRNAADALVATAQGALPQLTKTAAFPRPDTGQVRFYVLTNRGVYASESVAEVQLGNTPHPLSALFFAGHNVITELRQIAPQFGQ